MEKKKRLVRGFSLEQQFNKETKIVSKVVFDLKERQKTVTCNLFVIGLPEHLYDGHYKSFSGKAICHEEDEFNLDTGMDIALVKAQIKCAVFLDKAIEDYED